MNAKNNPLYVAYMALHLANKTLDEIPRDQMPENVREAYANNEDIKYSIWPKLNSIEQKSIREYNKDAKLAD